MKGIYHSKTLFAIVVVVVVVVVVEFLLSRILIPRSQVVTQQ